MKNSVLSCFAALLMAVCGGSLQAQTYLNYPFTEDVIYAYDGVCLDHDCHVGAAIKITKDMYKDYIGGTVKAIQVGWASPASNGSATAFFRTTLNDPTTNFSTSNATTIKYNGGSQYYTSTWSTINMKNAITLTDSLGEFYVGYTTNIKANEYCISTLYPHDLPGSCYLWRDEKGYNYDKQGKEIWEDQCAVGALAIRLVVTLPSMPRRAMINQLITPPVVKAGEEGTGVMTITNKGSDKISSILLTYTLADSTWSKKITLDTQLNPMKSTSISVPVYGIGSGEITAAITKVNNLKNNYEENEHKFRLISIPEDVAAQYPRRGLVEFYESESSYYVPNHYDEYFYPQYEQYLDNFSLVAHHTGDQFMTGDDDEVKMMTDFYGGNKGYISLPSESRDRTCQAVYTRLSMEYPILGITMPNYGIALYDEALERPTCVSVNVTRAWVDPASEQCEVKVKGNIADGIMGDEHLYLTVYLLEDGVESYSQEQRDLKEGYYVHNNVIRQRLTPMYGSRIENLSGEYEMTFKGHFNPDWVSDNMRVVAVVNRGMENGYRYANVMNCAEREVDESTIEGQTSIAFTQPVVAVQKDNKVQLNVKILPATVASQNLTWKSLAENIATVSTEGKVTAVAAGTAQIVVSTTEGTIVSDTCTVNVYPTISQYGYAPQNPATTEVSGYGSGKNNMLSVGFCLSPKTDPMFAQLKGEKIIGVRVYLREDYEQGEKGWSYVSSRVGSLEATPNKQTCNFKAGWNDITFSEPVTIGNDDIYLTANVLEEFGSPYPFCAFQGSSMAFYAQAGSNAWQTVDTKGVLLMQAIVATQAEFKNAAIVSFSDAPQIVNPGKTFGVNLYVHNMTADPINTLTCQLSDPNGFSNSFDLTFDQPIEAYGGRCFQYYLTAGTTEALNIPYTLKVTHFNGNTATETMSSTRKINVMSDAYERIPLVEEFTSQRCTACPQMAYYLDQDKEKWFEENRKLLYVTHHSGFANDAFTKDVDSELLYLFNSEETYNPGIMFDRKVFKDFDSPIMGTTTDYYGAMTAVADVAGMAKVNVKETVVEGGKHQVRVWGEVNKSVADSYDQLYLSCYVIEDSLTIDKYPQLGLDAEGAPEDLVEKFRHNGIIRINLSKENLGDELTITRGETYTFDVTYDSVDFDLKNWKWDNCDIVAFVHLINKLQIKENYVLNAGSMRYTEGGDGIEDMGTSTLLKGERYNLQGIQVGSDYKGIVIENGKLLLNNK